MPSVNPDVLKWARTTAGLTTEQAARKLQFKDTSRWSAPDRLRAIEAGDTSPTRSVLKRMSAAFRQPLIALYMPTPPRRESRGHDFRSLPGAVDPAENTWVDFLCRDVRVRQQLIRQVMSDEGDQSGDGLVDTCQMSHGVPSVVAQIVEMTDIDIWTYRQQPDQAKAFAYLRRQIEARGVFVLLAGNLGSYHTNLSTDVFRGFALADDVSPFIVVNPNDARTAMSVTLLHELTHLCLGQTGISGGEPERRIERFCDAVASSILVRDEELVEHIGPLNNRAFEDALAIIDEFADSVRVGPSLIAYRLNAINLLETERFRRLSAFFVDRWHRTRSKKQTLQQESASGPSYFVVHRHRLGNALVETTKRFVRARELSTTDAAKVLDVSPLKLGELFGAASKR